MHDSKHKYVVTFHTHLSAILTAKSLEKAGIEVRLSPVPRSLSSSCGTCVYYNAQTPMYEYIDCDAEAIYQIENSEYCLCRIISK